MFLIVVCRKCVFHHSPAHTYPNNSTLSRNCTHGSAVRALCPSLSRCLLLLLVLFTCFWLHWACVAARELSLVAASRGYSLVAAYRLRIAMASLVAEHRLRVFTRYSARASLPRSMWNLPRSGIEPVSPALAGRFLSTFSSVQFSRSVVSNSLQPHEAQHARPPCPSPTPRVHSDSRPSSR